MKTKGQLWTNDCRKGTKYDRCCLLHRQKAVSYFQVARVIHIPNLFDLTIAFWNSVESLDARTTFMVLCVAYD